MVVRDRLSQWKVNPSTNPTDAYHYPEVVEAQESPEPSSPLAIDQAFQDFNPFASVQDYPRREGDEVSTSTKKPFDQRSLHSTYSEKNLGPTETPHRARGSVPHSRRASIASSKRKVATIPTQNVPQHRKNHIYQTSLGTPPSIISMPALDNLQGRQPRQSSISSGRSVRDLFGRRTSSLATDDMESFFRDLSEIQDRIHGLDDAVSHIKIVRSKSLNTFPDTQEFDSLNRESDRLSAGLKSATAEIKSRIQALESTNGRAANQWDANVKRAQTANVKHRFFESVQRYSQIEAQYRMAIKQRLFRQYKVVRPEASDQDIEAAIEDPNGSGQLFSQAVLSSNRTGEARATLSAVRARQQDIARVETTLTELSMLFDDMANMVEEQGEQIELIHEKGVKVEEDMHQAELELGHAVVSARSARKKRWICFAIFIFVLVIAGVVVAVLVIRDQKSDGSSPAPTAGISSPTAAAGSLNNSMVSSVVTPSPSPSAAPSSTSSIVAASSSSVSLSTVTLASTETASSVQPTRTEITLTQSVHVPPSTVTVTLFRTVSPSLWGFGR